MQAVDCTNWRMQTVPDIKHEEDAVLKKEEEKKKTPTPPFILSLRLRTPNNKAVIKVGLVGST